MKALILAGGKGKRLNGLPDKTNKCMIRINGKHVIEYNFESAVTAGVDEIILVVGFRAEDIINTFGTQFNRTKIRYVIQWEQKGLVHAIESAKEALEEEDFLLMLGDEIMKNPRDSEMIAEYNNNKDIFGLCGVLWVEDTNQIKKTYTLEFDDNNRILNLIEKPENPLNHFQGTGRCVFNHKIIDYIDMTPIDPQRNEKELPGLIQTVINNGNIVKSFIICEKYININTQDDIVMLKNM